jgi:hypothetical protein
LGTSIWPLRILFGGYGTKQGTFRQRFFGGSYPENSKWRLDLSSNIECAIYSPAVHIAIARETHAPSPSSSKLVRLSYWQLA